MKKLLLNLPILLVTYILSSGFISKQNIRMFFCAWNEEGMDYLNSIPDESIVSDQYVQIFDQNSGQHYQYDEFMNSVQPVTDVKQQDGDTFRYSVKKVEGNTISYELRMFDNIGIPYFIANEVIDFDKNIITSTDVSGQMYKNYREGEDLTETTFFCKNIKLPDDVKILKKN